ncbi:cytidylate kinase family protein [Prolixibacter sp. NT017]|uniref:cytidylate kinase family protein n=1 Tax=Prolixibacter sp. NT017 TaxID=2652390 RepID=UPI001286E3E0|nr:cytidylate kinase family protein [Prolixibacter sp. NT017]GET24627.1 hypothetical protein NT017_09560 [Prolixibacter sp. NT017]
MKINNFTPKVLAFTLGLFVMAFGVALSVKANLGVSPISCVPYVFSLKYPLTLGETTIIMNVFLILLQMVLLRKRYQLFQLIQFPVIFLFGIFIDFTLHLISWLNPVSYAGQASTCLLGCVILAFGVFLEVKAGLTYLPGEGLAMAITQTFKIEFGKTKIGVDSSLVLIGIVSSLGLLSGISGIREGTVAAAVLVGFIVRFLNRKINFLDVWLNIKPEEEKATPNKDVKGPVAPHLVITISREYGSGGREIGKAVAEKLGLKFYDKNLIELTAGKSGFTREYIEQHEQKLAHTLLYDLYEQEYAYINERKPPLNALFLVQSKVIREIFRKESCVIVGRCANFILKDQPGCVNVFVHANGEFRKNKIVNEYGVQPDKADKVLERTDRERSNYCTHYTGKVWNDATNYHLTVDSSLLDIEATADLIVETVKAKQLTLA